MAKTSGVPEASGKAFLGIITLIKAQHGSECLQQIITAGSSDVEQIFTDRIHALAWYPYTAFTGFLTAIDAVLGTGDYRACRDLGAGAGERDLNTIFKLLKRLYSPERLIRSCGRVWSSYYRNAGNMEAVRWHPAETILRIYDFPSMHPAHCRLMEGWMIQTMRLVGARVGDDAAERACMTDGAPYHEFHCTWSR